jgi:hypothetical protein
MWRSQIKQVIESDCLHFRQERGPLTVNGDAANALRANDLWALADVLREFVRPSE